jgi:hypothetical protein
MPNLRVPFAVDYRMRQLCVIRYPLNVEKYYPPIGKSVPYLSAQAWARSPIDMIRCGPYLRFADAIQVV